MKIAFYKGVKAGIDGVYNKCVMWIEDGDYSHCELVFSNGVSASSSFMDGGVRVKFIDYHRHPEDWELIDIPWADEVKALKYFEEREGRPYNWRGNLHFLFGFIRGDGYGEFCSESCAGAIGFVNNWQFAPNQLYNVVKLINERFAMLEMNKNLMGDGDEPTGNGQPPDKPVKPPVNP